MIHWYSFWAYIQRNISQNTARNTGTSMLIAALFTIAKHWKQTKTKCYTTDDWIRKIFINIYTYLSRYIMYLTLLVVVSTHWYNQEWWYMLAIYCKMLQGDDISVLGLLSNLKIYQKVNQRWICKQTNKHKRWKARDKCGFSIRKELYIHVWIYNYVKNQNYKFYNIIH
jgi:hypothetical protein